MRGVRSTDAGIAVVDVPPGTDGVRVRVTSAGICGSDLHFAAMGPLPCTMGHEFGGELDDGTVVAVRPVASCGTCRACRAGRDHLCGRGATVMYGIGRDGGMADEAWVDPRCLYPLDPSVPAWAAALVEPMAVALHAVRRVGARDRVLVIGAGPIGLATIAALRFEGVSVDVEARHAARVAAAVELGAGERGDDKYETVIDAAGTQSSAEAAVRAAVPGGTIGLVGTWWSPVTLDGSWQFKELTLVPAFLYAHGEGPDDFADAAVMVARTPAVREVMVTHRFDLSSAREAFEVAGDRGSGAIKVLLHP